MALLILFGFVAGAATAVSPCVLPVLPVALASGATGGRRRPLGVVTGLVVAFTFATVALVYVIDALGLPDDLLRNIAIGVLAAFGLALLVPRLAAAVEARLAAPARIGARGASRRGDGFGSGLVIGSSLGLVYAPCAGPILAGVITVSAAQDFSAGRLAVAFAYGAGTGVVLLALMLGGRRLTSRLSKRRAAFQPAMGAVMLIVAVLMAAELDLRFQNAIAADLPSVLVNPSKPLEDTGAAKARLADLRGDEDGGIASASAPAPPAEDGGGEPGSRLPVLGRAPEIQGTQEWFNTDGGKPLTLAGLRGSVVLIDFWTYSCINCQRTLPYLRAWDRRYRDEGLTIIGVHSPEFPFERDARNVAAAIGRNKLEYAVAQDNDFAVWNAYGNQYWPAKYLIDAEGRVRYTHFGEGAYDTTENAIRSLLREAGERSLGAHAQASGERSSGLTTPESYLGAARADRFVNGPLQEGRKRFGLPADVIAKLPLNHLAYSGTWDIGAQDATAVRGAQLDLAFRARKVFLVLGSPGRERRVGVTVDGERHDYVTVDAYELYTLVDMGRLGSHHLTLDFEPGVKAYAFTFG